MVTALPFSIKEIVELSILKKKILQTFDIYPSFNLKGSMTSSLEKLQFKIHCFSDDIYKFCII